MTKNNERYVDPNWMDPTVFLERCLDRNPNKDNVMNVVEPNSGVPLQCLYR